MSGRWDPWELSYKYMRKTVVVSVGSLPAGALRRSPSLGPFVNQQLVASRFDNTECAVAPMCMKLGVRFHSSIVSASAVGA